MYEQVHSKQDLMTYRASIVETLLRDMAFGIGQTLEKPDVSNVHDLRRLVLRLRHALRLFGPLLPRKPARRLQGRLKDLQDLLGGVRSCDVALETIQHPEVASSASRVECRRAAAALAAQRKRDLRPLRARLRKIQRSDAIRRWRNRLLAA
jgi:CHAD domain-containing protein